MSRDTLGEFEQLVLLAALRLGHEAYAVSILEEIEGHTGRRPSHGAVFVALRRLERKGLVRQELGALRKIDEDTHSHESPEKDP